MAEPLAKPRVSALDYLAFERQSAERHELIDGEIVDMSGGTREHSVIAINLAGELRSALKRSPCQVFNTDLRVRVRAQGTEFYTYPDLSVACEAPQFEDEQGDTLLNPTALFEVLSDSTEGYDRGEKFARYRTIPSLQEYVLVAQKKVQVEHFHRQDDVGWLLRVLGPGDHLALPSLGCEIAVDEIYLKVFETG